MTSPNNRNWGRAEEVACEASHYLEVLAVFAALGADPHTSARARAARARTNEERSAQTAAPATTGKGALRWRT